MMLLLMYEPPTTALVWFSRFANQLLKINSLRLLELNSSFHPPKLFVKEK